MKPTPETTPRFDRTSTREELFQVIELLSAIKRAQGLAVPNPAHTDQFDVATENLEKDLADASTDDELALVAEIGPLSDLFRHKIEPVN